MRPNNNYDDDLTLHQADPSGQTGSAYLAAVVGTQTMMKMRSATARFSISRLVAVRARRYSDTTRTTTRFPMNPTNTKKKGKVKGKKKEKGEGKRKRKGKEKGK